jgi:MFS family permease
VSFHGWRVVSACFVIAIFSWTLGLFGASVYLQALTSQRGWSITEVSTAITVFFLVSAASQRAVGNGFDRYGARPVLLIGIMCMSAGILTLGQVRAQWQIYPAFVLIGLGWAMLSTTGLSATVSPWFDRHQGRAITWAWYRSGIRGSRRRHTGGAVAAGFQGNAFSWPG